MKFVDLTQKVERVACRSPLFFKLTTAYYTSMVFREIQCAGITKTDHVLCVGGGPCPHSAILIHSMTGAKVTVIDNDESSVRCSRKLLKRKGVSDQISVFHQDGLSLDPSGFSVIHIAAQITPKEEVFRYLWENADDGCIILMRLPKKKLMKFYVQRKTSTFVQFMEDVPRPIEKVKHGLFGNAGSTSLYIK